MPRRKAYGDILLEFKSLIEQELPTKAKKLMLNVASG